MKKKNSYFIYVEISAIILALLAYTKLLYPNEMLQMMDLTFDQYNTSGVMWSYWKVISGITRILVLITGVVNLYVIIGGFGKKIGRGVTAAISVDIIYAVWILLLENAGLFAFECVSIIILVHLVRNKITFSKAMILQLVIALVSFGLMRMIADMELWGVVIGVSSLVVLVLWLIFRSLYKKEPRRMSLTE